MIFTVPFALFGHAAPDLWLVVARAGALAAVVMVFRLAYRLTRQVGGLFGEPDRDLGTVTQVAPALLAGVIGAVSLALSASGGFVSANALGYSEGFAAALLLIAIERHLDGRPRQAFAVGFLVALDRPEIWLFWGPYGLWLMWKDPGDAHRGHGERGRRARRLVHPGQARLRLVRLQHVPRIASAIQQPGVRVGPVHRRAVKGGMADDAAADQGRRRAARHRGRR